MPESELVVVQAVNSEDSVQSLSVLRIGALSWKGIVETRFFLQLLAYEHNLNTGPEGRKNRWRQNQGDPE